MTVGSICLQKYTSPHKKNAESTWWTTLSGLYCAIELLRATVPQSNQGPDSDMRGGWGSWGPGRSVGKVWAKTMSFLACGVCVCWYLAGSYARANQIVTRTLSSSPSYLRWMVAALLANERVVLWENGKVFASRWLRITVLEWMFLFIRHDAGCCGETSFGIFYLRLSRTVD